MLLAYSRLPTPPSTGLSFCLRSLDESKSCPEVQDCGRVPSKFTNSAICSLRRGAALPPGLREIHGAREPETSGPCLWADVRWGGLTYGSESGDSGFHGEGFPYHCGKKTLSEVFGTAGLWKKENSS